MLTVKTSAHPQDLCREYMPCLANESFMNEGCLLVPFEHVQSNTCQLHHATTEDS